MSLIEKARTNEVRPPLERAPQLSNYSPRVASQPRVVSMVTKADLCQSLDLAQLALLLPQSVYEPRKFPGLFYYARSPRITFVVFDSGKVTGYGGQNLREVKAKFAVLRNALAPLRTTDRIRLPQITMLVGSAVIGKRPDVEALAQSLPHAIYETEQFPGLIWHYSEREVVLIFSSGKIVITGASSLQRLNQIYNEVLQLFE